MSTTPLPGILILLALIINLSHYSLPRCLATDTRLKFNCSSSSYEPNSTYEKNLNVLLSLLTENATLNTYGFYNTSAGGDDDGSGKVYGLYLCRGDDTRRDCRECVANATKTIFRDCPARPVDATTWYVDCMVRYSSQSMFRVVESSPIRSINTEHNENMTTNLASNYMALVGGTMHQLAIKAANSSNRYATMEASFTSIYTVYSMAQCTPDLSTDQCLPCLVTAYNELPNCCNNSKAALVMTPSCNIRYALKPFYKLAPGPPPPSPPFSVPSPNNINNSSSTDANTSSSGKRKAPTSVNIALVVLVAILVVLVSFFVYLTWRKGTKRYDNAEGFGNHNRRLTEPPNFECVVTDDLLNPESLQYDWMILSNATNNFSEDNKLGEGGFGIVFKGVLTDGQEIAVKRLSEGSSQGAEQFKNEVVFVARLQHRNLVKLLGFSMARYEKLLVYEYAPNKSLDLFLFDPERRGQLNWAMRFNIIKGIARGMLYLHEDSRLRIIHRDLKASNILLDADMNPKISDFGMARNFRVDESQANTSRIAGTFGYMAPEYILHGEFSVKSDVYSFGILVLEIVCGKKGASFRQPKVAEHISTHVWNKWQEDTPLETIDPCLGDSYTCEEVKRCIQIGLLCAQDDAEKRPTMASVVLNLNSDSELPEPQKPAFFPTGGHSRSCSRCAADDQGFTNSSSNSIQLSFGIEESISKSWGT